MYDLEMWNSAASKKRVSNWQREPEAQTGDFSFHYLFIAFTHLFNKHIMNTTTVCASALGVVEYK